MGKNLTRTLKRVHGNRIKGFENILKDSLNELVYHLGKGKNALDSSHPKNYKGGFFVAYYARLIFYCFDLINDANSQSSIVRKKSIKIHK